MSRHFFVFNDSYLDLHLAIDNEGRLKTKLCNNRDDWTLSIVNFPFISNTIPASPAYGVYISQLIRYSRDCDILDRAQLLMQKLLKQGYVTPRLKSSHTNFMVVITIWLTLRNIHILSDNGTFTFSNKKQELLTLR